MNEKKGMTQEELKRGMQCLFGLSSTAAEAAAKELGSGVPLQNGVLLQQGLDGQMHVVDKRLG